MTESATTTMSRKEIVENFIGESLEDFALRHDYPQDFFNVFSENYEGPEAFTGQNMQGKADTRTPQQYFQNIALAWVVEDYISDISNGKYAKNPASCDNSRTFSFKGITNACDLVDVETGRNVEVVMDFTGNVKDTGKLYFRNKKLEHLRKDQALIILVDLKRKRYLFRSATMMPFVNIKFFAGYGNKPAAVCYLNDAVKRFRPIARLPKKRVRASAVTA